MNEHKDVKIVAVITGETHEGNEQFIDLSMNGDAVLLTPNTDNPDEWIQVSAEALRVALKKIGFLSSQDY